MLIFYHEVTFTSEFDVIFSQRVGIVVLETYKFIREKWNEARSQRTLGSCTIIRLINGNIQYKKFILHMTYCWKTLEYGTRYK